MAQGLGRPHGTCWRKIASVTLATATAFAFTVPAGAVAATVTSGGSQVQSVHAQATGDTWKITWVTNGGSYSSYSGDDLPGTYQEGTGVGYWSWPSDSDMERDGYTFEGWYTNPEFTGDPVTGISESESGDKTFYAKWKKDVSYKVTFDESPHGSVALSYSTSPAKAGTTMYLDVSPDDGYALQKLTVKDASGNKVPVSESFGMKSFTMPEDDVTVSAEFVLESELKPTVDVSVDGQYTTAATEFDKNVGEGQDLYVKVSPTKASGNLAQSDIADLKIQWFVDDSAEPVQEDQGQWNNVMGNFKGSGYTYSYKCPTAGTHKVSAKAVWTIDGQTVESDPVTFTFNVTAAQAYAYKMNIQPSEHGKVTASQDGFNEGDTVTFSISPDEGYEIGSLVITDGDGTEHDAEISADGKTATFTFDGYWDDDYDMVTATFKSSAHKAAHSVKADPSQHGSYTLDETTAAEGDTVVIRATPDEGYSIPFKSYGDLVKVTDASGNAVMVAYSASNVFAFEMPASDVTVSVSFEKDEAPATDPVKQFDALATGFDVNADDAAQAQELVDAYKALTDQQKNAIGEVNALKVKVAEKVLAVQTANQEATAAKDSQKAAAAKAEQEKADADKKLADAKSKQDAAEAAQAKAEQAAKDAQTKQKDAESQATAAKQAQQAAEKAKAEAETAKAAADQAAKDAQTKQKDAEANEKAAETARKTAEGQAAAAKTAQQAAEKAKAEAETAKATAVQAAKDAQTKQKAAEEKLTAAEQAKTEAETAQASAEKAARDAQVTLVKASSVAKVKVKAKKGKKAKVSWKAPKYLKGVTYQVAYKAKGAKKWAIKSSTKTACTVSKLKAGKKYKFRVRAYKKIGGKKVYTGWMLYKDGTGVKVRK